MPIDHAAQGPCEPVAGGAASDVMLSVRGLLFGPARKPLANAVSFEVHRGHCLVLLGPNGAGKTSLLRTLNGSLTRLAGAIEWAGRALDACSPVQLARVRAFAASRPADGLDFALEHYVMLGRLGVLGAFAPPAAADRQAVDAVILQLGLDPLRGRVLGSLSDGERQLASIARALVQQSAVLLLDEPAASLDPGRQVALIDAIAQLAAQGLSIILSTHDPNHALRLADEVLLWLPGGELRWGGARELLEPALLEQAYGVRVRALHAEDGQTRTLVFG